MKLRAGKKPERIKPASRMKQAGYVLFVGDDGAVLSYIHNCKVVERLFAPNAEPDSVKEFQRLFAKYPKAPVTMLVDMMDQSFVRHTLPPVTALSVNKIVQRRLDRDFGPEDIKGAIPLAREKDGRKDWNYLLIALTQSPLLKQWIELVTELPNSFKGIYLVPIETVQFIRELSQVVNRELAQESSGWQLLVSHNRVGGFRQVVLKDGALIFTRMTQPIGESLPEVIAGNIEQEVQNTVEYLKRLSLQNQAGLEIYIIASKEIKDAVEVKKLNVASAHVFTPFEAAEKLSFSEAVNPGDHYGDVLLSAYFGTCRKHILKLTTPYIKKIDVLSRSRYAVRYVASLACATMVVYIGYTIFSMQPVLDGISDAENRLKVSNESLAKLQAEKAALPMDIDRINDVVSVYEAFSADDMRPLSFVSQFGSIMGDDVLVDSLQWVRSDKQETDGKTTNMLNVSMDIRFVKHTEDIERFVQFANSFFGKMRTTFKDSDVNYLKLPGTTAENEILQVSFDDKQATQNDPNAFVEGKPVVVQVTVNSPKAAADAANGTGTVTP